jgi:hypothetical protein
MTRIAERSDVAIENSLKGDYEKRLVLHPGAQPLGNPQADEVQNRSRAFGTGCDSYHGRVVPARGRTHEAV